PLPAGISPGGSVYEDVDQRFPILPADAVQNPTADIVLPGVPSYLGFAPIVGALAYEPATGGRVYWQFHPYGLKSGSAAALRSPAMAQTPPPTAPGAGLVIFTQAGKTVAQDAAGRAAAVPVTPVQVAAWRTVVARRAAQFRTSPDGKLRIEEYPDATTGRTLV